MSEVNAGCCLPWLVGQNGLLPNQDIFNALAAVSRRVNARLTFDGQSDSSTEGFSPRDKYFASLHTVLRMVAQQASGLQGGLHGVFVRQVTVTSRCMHCDCAVL